MFHECFVGRPYSRATRETQLSPSVLTLCIPVMYRAHASFHEMLSREVPVKNLLSSVAWVFTHSLSITQSLQLNPKINTDTKRLNKITIKFSTELKPTKHIVVNYNFTKQNSLTPNFRICEALASYGEVFRKKQQDNTIIVSKKLEMHIEQA